MKTLIHLFLTFLFFLPNVNAQEQHTYSSRESIFQNWIKRDKQSAYSWGNEYHKVGALFETYWYEIRNINTWQWTYNDIPTEATVTSVTIKFRARKGNYNDTFTFSVHNIPYPLNTPAIDFYSECNLNQIFLSSALTPDANNYVYFSRTYTSGDGYELWNAVNSAIQSGQNFITLGIRERTSLQLPYWAISAYDGSFVSPNVIDLIINFTTPDNYYTFKNKIQSNESYGSLILNENILQPISSGSAPVFLPWGTQNKIRTDELPFLPNWNGTGTTQKHNYWDLQSDTAFVLRYEFDAISNSPSILKATFLPTSPAAIKNQLAELGNSSLGTIGLVDPWLYYEDEIGQWVQDGASHFYSSPINIQNNSIDSYGGVFLNQGITPQGQWQPPYYSVKVDQYQDIPLTQTGKTHRFYFQNWTGTNTNFQSANSTQTPVVFTLDGATAQANLKGTQLSGVSTGFSNSGQRKFVATFYSQSQYHQVYSSMNSVWYEKADINYPETSPTNWQIMNNSKPLNGEINTTEGKSPCIDYLYETHSVYEEDYFIYIVYQKKKTDGKYEIRLAKFDDNDEKYFDISVFSSSYTNYSTFDAMPVVAVSRQSNDGMAAKIVIVWKRPAEGSASAGLYYMAGFDQGGSIQWVNSYPTPLKISSTDANSSYPTIAAYKNPDVNIINFHLAYQQGATQIKYVPIVFGVSGTNSGTPVSISTGSGWTTNIFPSISVNNNGPFHGYSYDSPKIVWSTGYVDGGSLMFRQRANMSSLWSAFQSYNSSDDILSPTINAPKYSPNGYDESFVFGCSELTGYYNFYISSDNLSSRKFFTTHGKDIQIANFAELGNGFGHSVLDNNTRTSAPFTFENRWTTGSFKKENFAGIHSGRSGVVVKNDAELYFVLGDMKVNDESVDFTALEDTAGISNLSDLNSYLISGSFSVDDNSNLTYSVYYGLNDSLIVHNNLSNEDQIRFKVELIDNETGLVIGTYDDVVQTKSTLQDYENISYQIAMNGIGNRNVKLRLSVSNNFNAEYALSNIYSYDQALGKGNIKELSWNGEGVVKEYTLAQNFPNPFNPSTTIRYQIPQEGIVTLKIYDILGSEIATLVNEEKVVGKYEANFNASTFASGVYIYKIQAGSFVDSKKMLLLK